MLIASFSHLVFLKNPIQSLAFFSLMMSLASLWIRKTAWLWGTFLLISLLCALETNILSPIAFLPLSLLALLFWALTYDMTGLSRFLLAGMAILVSGGLFFHFLPGFQNWNLARETLSPNAVPYHFWLNYDKPFVGLFILVSLLPTIESKHDWKEVFKYSVPWMILGTVLLLSLSIYFRQIEWDPKFPTFLLPWLFVNLFFVVIPEEAFLRGFIQTELFQWLGGGRGAHIGCVLLSSSIFTLFHVNWVGNLSFLLLVFVAGLIYGTIYQWTQKIESSILCHYFVNVCHFLLFTYPALAKAF
jgi:uncharacterized protein